MSLEALFRTSPAVDLADVASVWFNTFLLAQYVGGILGQLGGGSACNFVLLSTSLAYPPAVYAWTRVCDTAAKILRCRKCEWLDGTFSNRMLHFLGVLCFLPTVCVCLLLEFQVIVLIAMIITCFWAVAGFIHIFLCSALCVALFAALWAAPRYILLKMVGPDSDSDAGVVFLATRIAGGRIVLGTMSVCSLFFCASFCLYYHGDWLSFHNAFFDSAFAWPDPPSFSISTLRLCWELYLGVLTCEYVTPAHLMQLCFMLALIEQLLRLIVVAVTRGVKKAVRCRYPNSAQADS